MTSLGLRHGDCVIPKHAGDFLDHQSNRISGFTNLRHLTIPNLAGKPPNRQFSTAVNATAECGSGHRSDLSLFDRGLNNNSNYKHYNRTSIESPRVSETLDDWMRKSVTEIVKNLKQAPLLVQIYADGEVKTKKGSAENDWKSTPSLEGVILVEELRRDSDPADSGEGLSKTTELGFMEC